MIKKKKHTHIKNIDILACLHKAIKNHLKQFKGFFLLRVHGGGAVREPERAAGHPGSSQGSGAAWAIWLLGWGGRMEDEGGMR